MNKNEFLKETFTQITENIFVLSMKNELYSQRTTTLKKWMNTEVELRVRKKYVNTEEITLLILFSISSSRPFSEAKTGTHFSNTFQINPNKFPKEGNNSFGSYAWTHEIVSIVETTIETESFPISDIGDTKKRVMKSFNAFISNITIPEEIGKTLQKRNDINSIETKEKENFSLVTVKTILIPFFIAFQKCVGSCWASLPEAVPRRGINDWTTESKSGERI